MPANYSEDMRAKARLMYVVDGLGIEEIARRTGAGASTIRRWKKKDGWPDKRMERKVTGPELAQELLDMIKTIVQSARADNRPLDSKEMDGVLKLQQMAQRLDPMATFLSNAVETMDRLVKFIAGRDAELRQRLVPHMVDFLEELRSES